MSKRISIRINNETLCPQIYFACIFLLSAASLCYEINLTRIFSVTQFYHFAFLIVSLALLGFGASGAFLGLYPQIGRRNLGVTLYNVSIYAALSFLGAYLFTNYLPFDSFSFTLGWKQLVRLILHMVVLTLPFFFSGLSVILVMRDYSEQINLVYSLNLSGSAFGCLMALMLPGIISAVGIVIICTLFALLAGLALFLWPGNFRLTISKIYVVLMGMITAILFIFCLSDLYLRLFKESSLDLMRLNLSPYKGISYALQYPGAEIVYQKWNAYSRVDLVSSKGIRSLPGYSYLTDVLPPQQAGFFIDGDDLNAVILSDDVNSVTNYMPSSIAYILRPNAKVVILEPRGGLEIVIAHSEGAKTIDTSEPNPLIVEAAENIYGQDYVVNHLESGRSFLRKRDGLYDVIVLSLNSAYHPVRSGAYSLGEEYRYTTEAFEEALLRLNTGGLFIVTRWLQTPPSEFLRAFAIAVEAVDNLAGDPTQDIAAFRSYNTGTLVIKKGEITLEEIKTITDFTSLRAYDVVYYPGIRDEAVNKYSLLPEDYYYQAFTSLLLADSRNEWYRNYPYDVEPPTDDRPFFNQFFKWSQLSQVIAEYGKVWEPFGGAGFVILILILFLTLILSLGFILVPTIMSVKSHTFHRSYLGKLVYFAAIGLGFLLVEIPLIQTFILFLGNPAYSLAIVLFTLLFFSGLGSLYSKNISIRKSFSFLIILLLLNLLLVKQVINYTLGLPLEVRVIITITLLAPIGFFMGMPFPMGIRTIEKISNDLVPWAWGVNGFFSVVAGVAAILLAITFGFKFVFICGSLLYLTSWLLIRVPDNQIQRHPR